MTEQSATTGTRLLGLSNSDLPTPALAGLEARQSECTICPAWVVRCAHFDGLVLLLADNAASNHDAYCQPAPFSVCGPLAEPQWDECPNCQADVGFDIDPATADAAFLSDSLPAAEAEFERRAEALRLGQEAGA